MDAMFRRIVDSTFQMNKVKISSLSASGGNYSASAAAATSTVSNSSWPSAKPESCKMEMFISEKCPCNLTEINVVICENQNLKQIPKNLLPTVYKIRMSDNKLTNIDRVDWPRSLSSLVLVNNQITHLRRGAFRTAPSLAKLYLSHNNITYIDEEAFMNLSNLNTLLMESNLLTTFDTRILVHTPKIFKIHLSDNLIELPEETNFSQGKDIKELLLDHNRISIIRAHYFSNMTRLIWLSLTHNQISHIEDSSFDWNYDLQELNLSCNKIKSINRLLFSRRLNIQRLYLSGNDLETLPVDAFDEITELKSLDLSMIEFDNLNRRTFSKLKQLEFIYFAKFRYCHYANHVRVCRPGSDGLSSVEELLIFPVLKYAVWIVALFCGLGNVFVFVWRSISPYEDKALSFYVKNLSIADLLMGVYLSIIGYYDWKFQHHFGSYAVEWMSSWGCAAIGFLAILSSELSVFILTIITVERYRSIISIRGFADETQRRRARLSVSLAWIISILIASYLPIQWLIRQPDYYATNGLCLPLNINQPNTRGWEYSAFIYLGINLSAVIIMMALYAHMYTMIMNSHKKAKPFLFKTEKREDAILAIRFFFIVVTNCICWIPIVVIKVLAWFDVNISATITGWLVVFIIPVNSALNPLVYTLAAPTSLRAVVCRLFQRLCCRFDRLLWPISVDKYHQQNQHRHHGSNGSALNSSGYSSTTNNSCDSQASSILGRRRRKTGSSSITTCDTFDTSLISHSKASVESALMGHDSATNHPLITTRANTTSSSNDLNSPKDDSFQIAFERSNSLQVSSSGARGSLNEQMILPSRTIGYQKLQQAQTTVLIMTETEDGRESGQEENGLIPMKAQVDLQHNTKLADVREANRRMSSSTLGSRKSLESGGMRNQLGGWVSHRSSRLSSIFGGMQLYEEGPLSEQSTQAEDQEQTDGPVLESRSEHDTGGSNAGSNLSCLLPTLTNANDAHSQDLGKINNINKSKKNSTNHIKGSESGDNEISINDIREFSQRQQKVPGSTFSNLSNKERESRGRAYGSIGGLLVNEQVVVRPKQTADLSQRYSLILTTSDKPLVEGPHQSTSEAAINFLETDNPRLLQITGDQRLIILPSKSEQLAGLTNGRNENILEPTLAQQATSTTVVTPIQLPATRAPSPAQICTFDIKDSSRRPPKRQTRISFS